MNNPGIKPELLCILGVPFHNLTFEEAVQWSVDRMKSGQPALIATANTDFLQQARKDPELQRILFESDLIIADGMPIVALSRFFGPKLKERVTGSDITPMLAEACSRNNLSIFALGGADGVAEKAAEKLKAVNPELKVAGTYSPPYAELIEMDNTEIIEKVTKVQPDLLLIAFGAPKQEKWAKMNLDKLKVPLLIGVGGTLDFLAGTQSRAPKWVQRLWLEWFWRMCSDPKRLLKRYANNIGFMTSILLHTIRIRVFTPASRPSIIAIPEDPKISQLQLTRLETADEQHAWLDILDNLSRKNALLLDLRHTHWLNSLEIGALLSAARICKKREKALRLINVPRKISAQLALYRLDIYLKTVTDSKQLAEITEKQNEISIISETLQSNQTSSELRIPLPTELTVAEIDRFREQTEKLKMEHPDLSKIRIEAEKLEFLDSSAIGYLLNLKRKADSKNIAFEITGLHGTALQVLKVVKADRLLLNQPAP